MADVAAPEQPQQQTVHVVGSYIVGPTIGKGFFAKVKRVEDQYRNVWAMKCFDKERISKSAHSLKQVEKEINALRLCNHPNVVQFHEVLEVENTVYLIMEYVPHGELFDYIKSRGRLSEPEAVYLAKQVVSALDYCHRCGIVHRDIKPENVLIDDLNNIKIVDFGLATFYLSSDYSGAESAPLPSPEEIDHKPEADNFKQLQTQCGSPHYAAPEVLLGLGYHGPSADIWSLGVMLYAMVTGSLPFTARTIPQLVQKIVSGVYRFAPFMSRNAKHLIGSMLRVNPRDRITMREILEHPWFSETEAWIPPAVSGDGKPASAVTAPGDSAAVRLVSSMASQMAAAKRPPAASPDGKAAVCTACGKAMSVKRNAQGMIVLSMEPAAAGGDLCQCANPIWAAPEPGSTLSPPPVQGGGQMTMAKQFTTSPSARLSFDGFFCLPPPVDMARAAPSQREYDMIRACEAGQLEAVRELLYDAPPCPVLFEATHNEAKKNKSASGSAAAEAAAKQDAASEAAKHAGASAVANPTGAGVPPPIPAKEKKTKLKSLLNSMASAVRGDAVPGTAAIAPAPTAGADASASEDEVADVSSFIDWRLRGTCACEDQKHRLDLRARAADNWTALHQAARGGHAAVAEELILSCLPLDINARTKSQWTPLMLAADKGHIAMVELLLKYRADIHAVSADGKTAIFLARERNHTNISQRLTEASSTRHLAALKHNPFVSADASHALTTSEEAYGSGLSGPNGDGSGAGADEEAASPAILSIVHAVQSIKAATEAAIGAAAAGSPNGGSGSGSQDADAVRRAWFSASPLQADLFTACEGNDVARVKKLFELSVQAVNNMHATSPAGTPIPAAEVDFFARGIDNWSVMHYAARRNHDKVIVQIIECLVSANVSAKSIIAEINAVTKTGWTALMMAVDRGNVETVRLLLKCGADASIKSQSKESAQMLIAAHRNQPTFPYQVLKDLLDGKRA